MRTTSLILKGTTVTDKNMNRKDSISGSYKVETQTTDTINDRQRQSELLKIHKDLAYMKALAVNIYEPGEIEGIINKLNEVIEAYPSRLLPIIR